MEKVLTQLNAQAKKMDEEQAELEYRLREARKLEDDLRKEKDKSRPSGRISSMPAAAMPSTSSATSASKRKRLSVN